MYTTHYILNLLLILFTSTLMHHYNVDFHFILLYFLGNVLFFVFARSSGNSDLKIEGKIIKRLFDILVFSSFILFLI